MTNFSNEIIPYFLYFILILFYISMISKNKKKSKEKINKIANLPVNEEKIRFFLEDAELKLKTLNELYKDNLIELDLYTKKTAQIAKVVYKIIKNDVYEFGRFKNNEIINDLKLDIIEKFEEKRIDNNYIKKNEVDIDTLLVSVDTKIKKKEKI